MKKKGQGRNVVTLASFLFSIQTYSGVHARTRNFVTQFHTSSTTNGKQVNESSLKTILVPLIQHTTVINFLHQTILTFLLYFSSVAETSEILRVRAIVH